MDLHEIISTFPQGVKIAYVRQENSNEVDEQGCPIPEKVVVNISFCGPDWGFGDFTFIQKRGEPLCIVNEGSSQWNILEVLKLLVSEALLDSETDPEKHRKWKEIVQARCGDSCPICRCSSSP